MIAADRLKKWCEERDAWLFSSASKPDDIARSLREAMVVALEVAARLACNACRLGVAHGVHERGFDNIRDLIAELGERP